MFKKNTVFVLGAGASKPYGYPIGSELIDDIINDLKDDSLYVSPSKGVTNNFHYNENDEKNGNTVPLKCIEDDYQDQEVTDMHDFSQVYCENVDGYGDNKRYPYNPDSNGLHWWSHSGQFHPSKLTTGF